MAKANAGERIPDGDITWLDMKLDEVHFEPASFDLTACIGASHAFGNYDDALAGLLKLTRPGGLVLIGIGFMWGSSVYLGNPTAFDWFFDGLGTFWVCKGLFKLFTA